MTVCVCVRVCVLKFKLNLVYSLFPFRATEAVSTVLNGIPMEGWSFIAHYFPSSMRITIAELALIIVFPLPPPTHTHLLSLLASGSDDVSVIIWNPYRRQQVATMQTGHTGNIFSVKVRGQMRPRT